jgi:hypothetical protein
MARFSTRQKRLFTAADRARLKAYGLPEWPAPLPQFRHIVIRDSEAQAGSSQHGVRNMLESARTYDVIVTHVHIRIEQAAYQSEAQRIAATPAPGAGLNVLPSANGLPPKENLQFTIYPLDKFALLLVGELIAHVLGESIQHGL